MGYHSILSGYEGGISVKWWKVFLIIGLVVKELPHMMRNFSILHSAVKNRSYVCYNILPSAVKKVPMYSTESSILPVSQYVK